MSARPPLIARALMGSPLRRPLNGCLFVVGLLLLLGLAFLGHLALWILEPLPAALTFVGAALLAAMASIPLLLYLRYLDRREPETLWLFVGAIVWGMVVSTGVSAIFNAIGSGAINLSLDLLSLGSGTPLADILAAALIAPPVEEAAKGVALLALLLFMRAEFDNLRDGLIYGALLGLGFNIAEYALYVMQGYLESGSAPFATQFVGRFVFLGLNSHMLWTSLCGAGVGLARQTPRRWLAVVAPIVGYCLATLGHALNNSIGLFVLAANLQAQGYSLEHSGIEAIPASALWVAAIRMNITVQSFFYLLWFGIVWWSARQELAIIRTYLADEVGTSVTPSEYEAAKQDRIFGRGRSVRGAGGALVVAQNELAYRKWHLALEGGTPDGDALVQAWRQDIAALRERARSQEPGARSQEPGARSQ